MLNFKAIDKPVAVPGTARARASSKGETAADIVARSSDALARILQIGEQIRLAGFTATPSDPEQIDKLMAEIADDSSQLYRFDPQARIAVIRQGIPASTISKLSSRMGMSKEHLLTSLGLSRATISRKEKESTVLSRDESERVLGVETLIGMVQTMVEQSGDPAGFNAARWVADWLTKPLPALAGATPASYMDTFEGQRLVADLLSMSQSGAYA